MAKTINNYTADDIKSLSFRDGVRTRIGMYLGSADNEGAYQAFKEIINNSTDEAIAGYGKRIEIVVNETLNKISVRDYGRGVPFRINADGSNTLVDIYTKSHTGGKFDDKAYKNVGGLNGVGGSCVCLSSLHFKVETYRDNKKAWATFEKGNLVKYQEDPWSPEYKNGTYVEFIPDPEVFNVEEIQYSYDKICEDMHAIAYLYNGVKFIVINAVTGDSVEYVAKKGIQDFVKDNITAPMHQHVIYATAEEGEDKVEIAFQWGEGKEKNYVFVNGLKCPEGGTPITGAKQAITRTINSLTHQDFDGDSIRANLFYVINCSVANPSFANQTKSKVNNPSLRTLTANAFTEGIKQMQFKYSDEFEIISTYLKKVAKANAAAEKARQSILTIEKEINNESRKRSVLADKLKDCKKHTQESTLIITEGETT